MDTKILVLLLLGASLLVFGCAGKKAEAPPTFGDSASPEANDTTDDDAEDEGATEEDDEAADEDDAADDEDETDSNDSINASDKDLSDLADLFKVDADKPLEDEGFDIKSVDSNES